MDLNEFADVLLYMYYGYFNISFNELIPPFVLMERLDMNSNHNNILNQLKNKMNGFTFDTNTVINCLKHCYKFNNYLLMIECCNYIINNYQNISINYWILLDLNIFTIIYQSIGNKNNHNHYNNNKTKIKASIKPTINQPHSNDNNNGYYIDWEKGKRK